MRGWALEIRMLTDHTIKTILALKLFCELIHSNLGQSNIRGRERKHSKYIIIFIPLDILLLVLNYRFQNYRLDQWQSPVSCILLKVVKWNPNYPTVPLLCVLYWKLSDRQLAFLTIYVNCNHFIHSLSVLKDLLQKRVLWVLVKSQRYRTVT
jgi:hypothetical protein